jgi:hypothetical protein
LDAADATPATGPLTAMPAEMFEVLVAKNMCCSG